MRVQLLTALPALCLTLGAGAQGTAPTAAAPTAAAPAASARIIVPIAARNNADLAKAVEALCAKYPGKATQQSIGNSASSTAIPMIVLTGDPAQANARPGLLVVAGLDGHRWGGTEAALVMAETLATERAALLDTVTVFIVPRANPDAAETFATGPKRDYSGNNLMHDNDRDRRVNENPPQDLNGDGLITLIRAKNVNAPYGNPTMVADTTDPRIMRAPDPVKGEVAEYTVLLEGIDMDGDGRISEDGKGGVVPERNFPHRWPEFEDESGAYPLVAPEAAALAQFVLAHPTLAGALVLGRVDTVVSVPDGRARTEAGPPQMISEDDAKAYAAIAKIFRDTVGTTRAAESDSAGSFVAWMNAQRGVPTFATQLWSRPEPPAPKEGEAAKPAAPATPDASATPAAPANPQAEPGGGAPPATATPPATPPGPARAGAGRGGRGGRGPTPRAAQQPTASEKVDATSPDDSAWLAISDAQGGAGFVAWKSISHPQLGEVEVGGWVPGWRENPPLDQVQALGDKCAAFLALLADNRAKIGLDEPRVIMLGPGLYQVEATLANRGKLASIQQGGRTGEVTPAHVVRMSPPVERIKSGSRMAVVRGMTPGESRPLRWVVAAPPEEVIELELLFAGVPVQKYSIRGGEVLK